MRARSLAAPLAALVMLAPGPVAAQAPGAIQASQPERIVAWTGADAGQRRARVPEDALRAFLAERAEADERARRAAARGIEAAMARALRPVLADAEERMAAFVDWVFDWWTAYILLGQTAGSVATTGMARPDAALAAAAPALNARVAEAYRRLVLAPAATDRRLRGASIAADRAARAALHAECVLALEAASAFLARHARAVESGDGAADRPRLAASREPPPGTAAHGIDPGSRCARLVPGTDLAALAAAPPTAAAAFGPGPGADFLAPRLARPVLTTAATTALRIAVPAVGTAVVLGGITISGIAAGTGIDYGLNEMDEGVHRARFAAEAERSLRAATDAFEAAFAARHRAAAEGLLEAIRAELPRAP